MQTQLHFKLFSYYCGSVIIDSDIVSPNQITILKIFCDCQFLLCYSSFASPHM